MTCHNCGAAVAADATTCATCGAALARSTPPPSAAAGAVALPSDVRTWAMAAHISAPVLGFLSAGLLFFLGPLLVWLIKRNDHPFIDHHGREAVNFNLSMVIYGIALMVVAVPLGLLTLGLGLIPLLLLAAAIAVAWLIFSIVAAVKASKGESYRYPLTLRLVN